LLNQPNPRVAMTYSYSCDAPVESLYAAWYFSRATDLNNITFLERRVVDY